MINKTKIIATLGPSTSSKEMMRKMILKGVNVVLSEEIMLEINQLYKKFPITF